jgi:uncharacterized membrane protein YkoI
MRTNRSLSAALILTLTLTLTACADGDAESPGATGTSAEPAEEAATATATQDDAQTASAVESDDSDGTEDDGSDDEDADETSDDDSAEASGTGEATEPDDDADDDGRDDDSDGVVGGGPAADLTPSALAAVETALGEVDGTAYEVDDREDGFWEVDVMTEDGAVEVTVAPDGTTVDGTADDSDDALDDAGRRALAGARFTLAEAVVAAVRASEGQLDSAELAEHDGGWWWRVVVDSPDQDDVELRVDPVSGKVVAGAG